MSKASQKLSVEQLAKLFIQLSALESAGLPVFQAFAIITQSEAKLKKPLVSECVNDFETPSCFI